MHSNQENKVYIGGLDKADLLVTLYLFALHKRTRYIYSDISPKEFVEIAQSSSDLSAVKNATLEEAKCALIKKKGDIGWFRFMNLKVNLSGDYLDTLQYNRDNGQELAEEIIKGLHKKQVSSQITTPQVESHMKEHGK
ncbi:MAG: hypothetical protein sL5_08720 [Candidatus Mesenet longicola]|uniref:Uncharacterized protein n=1 Tax=Candidatus Mesenet longicola TaxID=1892558 RepID=A0A8J3HVQ8_9RICK|nr:MAG: hypothetical protein sGL2_09560 [Candidatus Mesenet longicola]GHM59879.1 MAG: hypothetical protein sL5_08720 [Candidatus Mesenet longicola]